MSHDLPRRCALTRAWIAVLGLSVSACAPGPSRRLATGWMQDCQQSLQPLALPETSVLADFDADGEVEILSAISDSSTMRLTSWDRIGDRFEPVAETSELDPWLLPYAHPIEFGGQPGLVRSTGSIVVLAWPSLELLYSGERGSPRLRVLGDHAVFISGWGPRSISHGAVFDPHTEATHPVTIAGSELDLVAAPDASLMGVYEASDGRRTLAHLELDGDRAPTVELYPWPRGARLLASLQLDDDPMPELLGVRRRQVAIVDWREGEWRWSAPLLSASETLEVVGAFPLDDSPGIDILLWRPAILLSGCSGRGCAAVSELSGLAHTSGRAHLDEAGVLTWLGPNWVSQLRCIGSDQTH